jgi:signal transduction histidine kinase
VANLADNALRHNVPGGTVWVTAGCDDGRVFLTVANTGEPIRPEAVDRLLLPFQRGAEAGHDYRARRRSGPDEGLGLGLSIVAAIATAHGAGLTVTPRLTGGGLTVRLAFPDPPAALVPGTDRTDLNVGRSGPSRASLA